jgi:hypothetical protein
MATHSRGGVCRLYLPNMNSVQACKLSNMDEKGLHGISGDVLARLGPTSIDVLACCI